MAYYPTNYRYDKNNRVKVTVGFNRKTEPELAEWMEGKENRSGYLKELAQKDMEREKKDEDKK